MKENLTFLLDFNTTYFLSKSNDMQEKISIQELLTSLILFINSYIIASSENTVTLYVYDSNSVYSRSLISILIF